MQQLPSPQMDILHGILSEANKSNINSNSIIFLTRGEFNRFQILEMLIDLEQQGLLKKVESVPSGAAGFNQKFAITNEGIETLRNSTR